MPNWTDNALTIYNLLEEEIQELEQAAKNENFCNFIVPSPDWANIPNEQGELPQSDPSFPGISKWSDGTQDLRWYSWNTENWGSKWSECFGNTGSDVESGMFAFSFETAWSPLNENFLRALSLKYPRAKIILEYMESGEGFIGASVARNGEVLDRCLDFSSLEEKWFEAEHKGEEMDEDERQECWCEEMDEYGWEFLGQLSDELMDALVGAVAV